MQARNSLLRARPFPEISPFTVVPQSPAKSRSTGASPSRDGREVLAVNGSDQKQMLSGCGDFVPQYSNCSPLCSPREPQELQPDREGMDSYPVLRDWRRGDSITAISCKSRRKLDIARIACVYAAFKHILNFGSIACNDSQRPPLTMKTVSPVSVCSWWRVEVSLRVFPRYHWYHRGRRSLQLRLA